MKQTTELPEILAAYDFPETLVGAVRYGCGHINDTYCVLCQPQEGDCVRFILQGLSSAAFPHPEELMENFVRITDYLREKIRENGGDPARETLGLALYTLNHRYSHPLLSEVSVNMQHLLCFCLSLLTCCVSCVALLPEEF